MSAQRIRHFCGPSRHYPAACVELRFPAPPEPVALADLAETCRALPYWQDEVPLHLPAEEAIARIGRHFVERHIPAWCSFRREQSDGIVALGTFAGRFAALLLVTLERALFGSADEQAEALPQLGKLDAVIAAERSINWTVIDAARRLGIDSLWLIPREQIYQLGIGAKGRHFLQLTNDADGTPGWVIAGNKHHTVNVLRQFGFPTTRAIIVRSERDVDAAIRQVGFPCVVKPLRLGKGRGITTGITRREDLVQAIQHAIAAGGSPVQVENHVTGIDHRLMVIGGEVLWAYSKVPASVTGDGRSTVRALIERENERRRVHKRGKETLLEPIVLDDERAAFLARRYGIGFDHVLAPGESIELAGQSNISLGGILEEVTSQLHPDNRQLMIDVAQALRLAVVGIDFLTPDLSRSWKALDCAIIEVNCTPGISGRGDAALAVRSLFPNRHSGRIPVLAAVGSEAFRRNATERLLGAAERAGASAALVELEASKRTLNGKDRPGALTSAMLDPRCEALVLGCDPEFVEQRGFPLLHADLIVAEDPASLAFLATVADEITALPPPAALAKRVAAVVAASRSKDEGGKGPTLTLRPPHDAKGRFTIECQRFRALPRAWLKGALGLAHISGEGMLTFADLFAAVGALAGDALREPIALSTPPPGWDMLAVEGVATPKRGATDAARAALEKAIQTINTLIDEGPR